MVARLGAQSAKQFGESERDLRGLFCRKRSHDLTGRSWANSGQHRYSPVVEHLIVEDLERHHVWRYHSTSEGDLGAKVEAIAAAAISENDSGVLLVATRFRLSDGSDSALVRRKISLVLTTRCGSS